MFLNTYSFTTLVSLRHANVILLQSVCYFYLRYSFSTSSLSSFYPHGFCIHYNMWQCFSHITLFKNFWWISELYLI